jgi:hypothetical protein
MGVAGEGRSREDEAKVERVARVPVRRAERAKAIVLKRKGAGADSRGDEVLLLLE